MTNLFTKNLALIGIFFLSFFYVFVGSVNSQESVSGSLNFAVSLDGILEDVEKGDIIDAIDGGYVKSSEPYSTEIYGVITDTPSVGIENLDNPDAKYSVTNGIAEVKVVAQNGEIAEGDPITTSSIPGVGMKATERGMILGYALEKYSDAENIGLIRLSVGPEYLNVDSANNDIKPSDKLFGIEFNKILLFAIIALILASIAGVTIGALNLVNHKK